MQLPIFPLTSGLLPHSLQRLREHPVLRDAIRETGPVRSECLVQPIFLYEGPEPRQAIEGLVRQHRFSLEGLKSRMEELVGLGIRHVLLFGSTAASSKDETGSVSLRSDGLVAQAIRWIKEQGWPVVVMADVCLCPYTVHGHCGVPRGAVGLAGTVALDHGASCALLAKQALVLAEAGADVIAPSAMVDGQVGAIRRCLDQSGYHHLPILGYSMKYASSFYGPFRVAAGGSPKPGTTRAGYQASPFNGSEALAQVAADIAQGASMVMIKPAHSYLDIIRRTTDAFPSVPCVAYHTSGEYAMLMAALECGWIGPEAIEEVLVACFRAGARLVISYAADQWCATHGLG